MNPGDTNQNLGLIEQKYSYLDDRTEISIINFFNNLNKDKTHYASSDDICTPMECVKKMVEYIPSELWEREKLSILDPCAGNGNFGAFCSLRTSESNIWFNELSRLRYQNCKTILSPTNISNNDFFNLNGEWDLIIANPPYSGGGNKNRSLSNSFIERAIDLLANRGYLCFVTPNNWMTFNNNNTTLRKLLDNGSFLVIDNDVKKFFPQVGSSFTIFVWQKGVMGNETHVVNNYLLRDIQTGIRISRELPFIPLYISQPILDLIPEIVVDERNNFNYRCDLHNFTQKKLLSDTSDDIFKYKTIHTMRKTRYSSKKQEIYDLWNIIIPLSTYYLPVIMSKVNTTQSVGYISFKSKHEADEYIKLITLPHIKLMVHLTRFGNFNNVKVLKHLKFGAKFLPSRTQEAEIRKLSALIPY